MNAISEKQEHHNPVQMFANRLQKNIKHLRRWLNRENIHCYRIYDADIPEYAFAIDVYQGKKHWIHVQEYAAPKHINEYKTLTRQQATLNAIKELMEIPDEQLFFKVRRQQKGQAQYEKLADNKTFHHVMEGGYQFLVNFQDYLDTGLFLDHRNTRRLLEQLSHGKHFLNLFAYTASATVYAAKGGAISTTTVDMSNTYLKWASNNLVLNDITGKSHQLIQANCLEWLNKNQNRYGLIFLDPPSFSSSKRMSNTFDVQRDHVPLINNTVKLLEPGGTLIFSNNRRHFKMELAAFSGLKLENITRTTLPKDFARNPHIHNCWKITRNHEAESINPHDMAKRR